MQGESGRGRRQIFRMRGISLVELIVFIVIVGIAVAGLMLVFTNTLRKSGDPVIQKQALSIAESLLEEVQAKPFTFCDPNDPQAATAQSATVGVNGCKIRVEAIGPDTAFSDPGPIIYQASTETRTSPDSPFDNVNDYGPSLTISPITDLAGNSFSGLAGYSATITVQAQALNTIAALDGDGAPQSLAITVTVIGPGNESVSVQGYRTRYAPNGLP
jgi:MSHA pilin protein MshD